MHLRKLQILLVDDVVRMCEGGDEEPKDWEDHLEAYSMFPSPFSLYYNANP